MVKTNDDTRLIFAGGMTICRCKNVLLFSVALLFHLLSCNQEIKNTTATTKENKTQIIGPGGGGATFIPTFFQGNPLHFLERCDMTGSYLTKDGGASYQQINFANGASSYA